MLDRALLTVSELRELLLPKLVPCELASALYGVPHSSWPEPGEQGGGALLRDDPSPAGEQ